jgi:hypothetical protein
MAEMWPRSNADGILWSVAEDAVSGSSRHEAATSKSRQSQHAPRLAKFLPGQQQRDSDLFFQKL